MTGIGWELDTVGDIPESNLLTTMWKKKSLVGNLDRERGRERGEFSLNIGNKYKVYSRKCSLVKDVFQYFHFIQLSKTKLSNTYANCFFV